MEVRVTRPIRMAELKISGLDDFITKTDVALAIGTVRNTSWMEVKTSEITRTQRGMGILWARCPLEAAIKTITSIMKEPIKIQALSSLKKRYSTCICTCTITR